MTTPIPKTIPQYLEQLRVALAGSDPALVQDALYDAEEYLRSEWAEQPGVDEATLLASVAGSLDDALLVTLDVDDLGQLAQVLDDQTLNVQRDVGNVLDNARDRGDLVLHALDSQVGDGGAFEARQQHAPQTVANSHAETAFKRLGHELSVGIGECRALGGNPARQFQPTPFDPHG